MARPRWPLDKRFWAKVKLVREPNGCLLWKGNKNPKGYGTILLDGAGSPQILATHAALKIFGIEVPKGVGVFHTCDNPPCVYTGDGSEDGIYEVNGIEYKRWGHLWMGPRLANNKDMWNKHRSNWQVQGMPNHRGALNTNAKLNDDMVRKMRLEYKYGGGTYTYIAKLHEISLSTAQRAIDRTTWKHVA